MNVRISKSILKGEIEIPSSKSQLHRAIICAGLSSGISYIKNISICDDITATINAIISLGADVKFYVDEISKKECLKITGYNCRNINKVIIDCKSSATTLRLFLSIVAILGLEIKFIMDEQLMRRPLDHLMDELIKHGITYEKNVEQCYIISKGKVFGGEFFIRGDISSQYISGLLMALPLIKGISNESSKVYIVSELQSSSYIDMTIDILSKFNIVIDNDKNGFIIPLNQKFKNKTIDIEGDYSIGANFLVVQNINSSDLIIKNLNKDSLQGEKVVVDIINMLSSENNIELDARNYLDIVPILCVLFCYKKITGKIYNVNRLKFKESDRLKSICESLKKMGGYITCSDNEIIINGTGQLKGGVSLIGYNDHRIVMALAIAGLNCGDPIVISDAQAVNKSFPEFWEEIKKLGANIEELS